MGFIALLCLPLALPDAAFAAQNPRREEPVEKLPKWPEFIARQNGSEQALLSCEQNPASCTQEIGRWSGLISNLRPQNKLRQLITVNRWFNRLPYKYDEYAYNTLDYWADTQELLQKKGDCEDYALSKYFTLRQLGFDAKDLKITVVYDSVTYTNHAVLMVTMNGARYLLDINSDDMDPDPIDWRYQPIYSFNEKTAWFY